MQELPILIIDDGVWMQRILAKIVASYGFTPLLANNGFDGVAMALEHSPVLILLDVIMPELTGHQTLQLLKRIRSTKGIPIIMVTSVSDIENISMAIKAGASGFVGKPFTRATIFGKIHDVLGKDVIAQANLRTETSDAVLPAEQPTTASAALDSSASTLAAKQKPAAPSPHSLPERYKDDDKKNIEAVKELLLSRKQ